MTRKAKPNSLRDRLVNRAKAKKAKQIFPNEFERPLIIGSRSKETITKILDTRLVSLCAKLRIKLDGPSKYRNLSLFLLADVLGLKGFQVHQTPPRGRGGTVFWTVQQQLALIKFVDEQEKAGMTRAQAFALARDELIPDRTEDTVKVAYHRAIRLFKANPRTAAVMALIDRSPEVARNFRLFIDSPTILEGKRK